MHLSLNSAPAWSISGRKEEKLNANTPGPGNYSPNSTKFDISPKFKIGTASRDSFLNSTTPGPGAYDTIGCIQGHPSAKIGTSSRVPLSETLITPGPGAYNMKSSLVEGPQFSMPGRNLHDRKDNSPGPGQYDHSLSNSYSRDRAPAYKIGSGSRTDRPSSAYIPGPGAYNTEKKDSGPKCIFGSQSRTPMFKIEVPGPGAYSVPGSLSKSGCSISGRREKSPIDSIPGPGAYNTESLRSKSPVWTMGKSPRSDFTASGKAVPGPGSYTFKADLGKTAPVFGTSSRNPLSKISQTPGPGEYTSKNSKSTPAFSMRPKTPVIKKSEGPGPGAYNMTSKLGDCKWTIGKEQRRNEQALSKTMNLPGPGQYDVRKGMQGPKWGFGSAARNGDKKNMNPGPGTYGLYSTIGNLPSYAKKSINR